MTCPLSPLAVSLRQLQYIVAVADLGGFGRAAEQCHVSQPSLSAQVALAEEQLGVQIFERSKRSVRLSAAGGAIVDQARKVLAAQHELEELAAHLKDPFRGTLRLGVIPTVGPYLLPEIVPELATRFPNLTLHWTEERTPVLVRQIKDGTLDAAILALGTENGDLDHVKLGWDPFVLAAASNHPLVATDKPARLEVLNGAAVLLLDDGHCFRDQALSLCTRGGAKELGFRATSLATLVQMVSAGSSVTLLPSMALPVENRRGQLRVRPFSPTDRGRTLVLAWRKESALRVPLGELAGTIRAALDVTTSAASASVANAAARRERPASSAGRRGRQSTA